MMGSMAAQLAQLTEVEYTSLNQLYISDKAVIGIARAVIHQLCSVASFGE